ncbi:HNH endonuclease family protein [Streptomyces sp. NPDC087850]|uniref:HNH endonuclease family protein n=1 Tax=Streptomyces sp. NPDC087850 TaxID=3365809 RepID=UPI0038211526
MIAYRPIRSAALALSGLLASLALTVAAPASAESPAVSTSARAMPEPVDAGAARGLLADLVVMPEVTPPGYTRAKFPHWITQFGTCDTREVTLKRDGTDVAQDAQCRAVSGSWYSEYDGATWTNASDIDIDHVVPLKEAWRSGAADWSTEQRRAFANDLTRPQIIAVTDNVNQAKGDKDPARWMPPLASYKCTYVRAWVEVKHFYNLSVDLAEGDALRDILNSC